MKRFLILFICTLCAITQISFAAPASVDPTLVPFQKGELQKKLRANKDNAHGMVLLLRRADEMSTSRVDSAYSRPNANDYNAQAMKTLTQMRREQPENMKVLAAYCFEFDIKAQGGHHQFAHYEPWSSAKEQQFRGMLKELYKKAPDLWVPYAIEGYHKFYASTKTPAEQERGMKLLAKAVELAPNVPIAHHHYGYVCHYAADWQKKPELYGIAVAEYKKALQLRPVLSVAALDLLYAYVAGWLPDGKPDKAKAQVVAKRYLTMLPKGYVFADYEKRVFKSAGVALPR